ncbi:Microtubule-associated protein, microtubule dynamics during spindle orientation [Tulasnella sp. 419]|nr:Microtubule-associated protein, microtubule dynamics during spindle orientation [Tulasnella sp. 419]
MDGPPPPEEDFSTIPILDRIVHKNWKARLDAYENLPKIFSLTTSDDDPAFKPYISNPDLLKKIVTDSNAVAQEKAIDALNSLLEYAGENAAKTRDAIVPALVDKCLGSSRNGTKAKAIELILRYIEVENGGEAVVRDILPGLSAKQPKVVAGCVSALNEAFRAFGPKVIPPKDTLKSLPKIFGHTDKTVRAEGTNLVQALYTHLGPALQPFLTELKPVQVKELNESFAKLDSNNEGAGMGKQLRFTRAQKREKEQAAVAGEDSAADGAANEEEAPPDPRAFMEEEDVIPKIPSDFYEMIASSKWKERKETLEATLEKVKATPKIKDVDGLGELTKALAKRMGDANILCVILAAQVVEALAENVGNAFGKHRATLVVPMMERFKERKQNVVDALGQALDAVFKTTTLPEITEEIFNTLKSKNPQVKEGTTKFLVRALATTRISPGKNDVKPLADTLVSLMEDSYEPVRAAAAEGLGTLMKIVGERMLNPTLEPLDDLRKSKVKEAFDKATVKCKFGAAPPAPKAAAPPPAKKKAPPKAVAAPLTTSAQDEPLMVDVDATPKAKPPARLLIKKPALQTLDAAPEDQDEKLLEDMPAVLKAKPPARLLAKKAPVPQETEAEQLMDDAPPKAVAKPPARLMAKKPAAAASESPPAASAPSAPAPKKLAPGAVPAATKASAKPAPPSALDTFKYKYTPEDAESMYTEMVPAQYQTDLGDANWKTRLAALDEMMTWLEAEVDTVDAEVLMRFFSKKPGWNEKNFQVSAKLYGIFAFLAERSASFSKGCIALSTGHLAEKLGDMKLKKPAGEALLQYAEKSSLQFVLGQAYDPLSKQKAPKVLADSIAWIGQALTEFGVAGLSLRSLIDFLKTGLKNSNAAVRSSATSTLVTVKLFVGSGVKDFLEDLNPQLLATIESEFAKVDDQPAPVPTRTSVDVTAASSASTSGGKGKGGSDPLDELFPRVDLDKLVSGTSIIADAKSDAWKSRKEALELLQSILDVGANKRLKPNMGDIGQVLKARVGDSNKIVQSLALDVVSRIASGMNKPFEKYSKILVLSVAQVLADQKANTRQAATNTLTAIATACEGLDSMVNPLASALESTNPQLRASLLGWMGEWLKAHEPPHSLDLSNWASSVVQCLDDRNGEVRKGAQAVLPYIISSAGYDFVVDKTNSMKAASRSAVLPMIQAAKAAAPSSSSKPGTSQPTAKSNPSSTAPPAPTVSVSAAEPQAAAPPTKRAPANLRLGKLGNTSRPESRTESLDEDGPLSAGGVRLPARSRVTSRPISMASSKSAPTSPPPSGGLFSPFAGSNPDSKKSRLLKDGPRWIIEGLPVRKDLLDALHHQMESHTSKELMGLLFSKDHNAINDYVKGLETISECYSRPMDEDESSKLGLIANSDLVLKYVSLRIHEPQPNLVVRCLDVLDSCLAFLAASDYTITDPEALCFLPTVIHKLGDSRETVRVRVQAIIQNISKVYPSSRIFQLLLEHGLKSKVAKTRQGTVDELGNIIKRSGLSACDPSKAFPQIAVMIADKDAAVRKSALTAISEGYVLAGDKIWDLVGTLPPKEKTQLEERLKRTNAPANTRSPARPEFPVPAQVARLTSTSVSTRPASPSRIGGIPRAASPVVNSKIARSSSPPGSKLSTSASPSLARPASQQSTYSSKSPARGKANPPSRLGLPRPLSVSISHPPSATSQISNGVTNSIGNPRNISSNMKLDDGSKEAGAEEIDLIISSILSSDPSRSVDALKKIQKILDVPSGEEQDSPAFKELTDHTEGLIETITLQMSHVFDRPKEVGEPHNFRLAKHLIQTLNSFCDHSILAESLTVEILTSLLEELTTRLLQTDESEEQKVKDLSKFINMIVLRLFAAGRRISIFRALFQLLLNITKPFPSSGTAAHSKEAKLAELVLKCVWKMARNIPQDLSKGLLDPVELFPAIEQFLQSIPPNEWRARAQNRIPAGDMPLRTIKVIIQHIVAQYPDEVYEQLSDAFEDPSATIVYPYVYRILNSTPSANNNGSANTNQPSLDSRSPPHVSSAENNSSVDNLRSGRSASPGSSHPDSPPAGSGASTTQDRRRIATIYNDTAAPSSGSDKGITTSTEPDPDARLIEIIDHISSDTTGAMHKEGITELHHFLKEYPHKKPKVDKMLDATGPQFRKYISRALASRAAEDEERELAVADTLSRLEAVRREPTYPNRRASGSGSVSGSTSPPRRVSSGGPGERRFSTASDTLAADDGTLSRLHNIFNYQGRSSVVANGQGHHRVSSLAQQNIPSSEL